MRGCTSRLRRSTAAQPLTRPLRRHPLPLGEGSARLPRGFHRHRFAPPRALRRRPAHRRHLRRRHPDPHPRAAACPTSARSRRCSRSRRTARRVVPLLGGHRGANDLARDLAAALGGHAAITTAGDNRFGVALDAPPAGWTLANPRGRQARHGRAPRRRVGAARRRSAWLAESRIPFAPDGAVRLVATTRDIAGDAATLVYHPRRLALGIGCERERRSGRGDRARPPDACTRPGSRRTSVACVASIDLKADEPAVLEAARDFGVPARFFAAPRLEAETPRLANPSEAVFREVGLSRRRGRRGAGRRGRARRRSSSRSRRARASTCAIAEAPDVIDPSAVGRARGRLAVVGIGPGAPEWLTPEARGLLEASDAAVGYSLYLDLDRAAHRAGRALRFRARLGGGARAAGAWRWRPRADPSRSSRPAMPASTPWRRSSSNASTAGGLPDAARRIEIVVAPGISAHAGGGGARRRAARARFLRHLALRPADAVGDDRDAHPRRGRRRFRHRLLQPRLAAPAHASSQSAKAILLQHRPPRHAGGAGAQSRARGRERHDASPLADLEVDMVDMLTLVLVGASTTRQVAAGGRSWTYTPRGYDRAIPLPLAGRGDGKAGRGTCRRAVAPIPSPYPPRKGEGNERTCTSSAPAPARLT